MLITETSFWIFKCASATWTVMKLDTHIKPVTSTPDVSLPFVTCLLTLPCINTKLKKQGICLWNKFNWLRLGSNGWPLRMRKWTFGVIWKAFDCSSSRINREIWAVFGCREVWKVFPTARTAAGHREPVRSELNFHALLF
jgi:hypothetical protein